MDVKQVFTDFCSCVCTDLLRDLLVCRRSDTTNPEDYIGPAKSGLNADLRTNESNSVSVLSVEANAVSAVSHRLRIMLSN